MDSAQLRYFISAAQSQNFSEAARRHYITQPAISHHISALEDELGVPLFIRTGRQVKLTSAGEMFLPEAVELVDRLDASVTHIQRHSAGMIGNISIGMVNTSNSVLIKCLSAFNRQYPNIQTDVSMNTGIDQSCSISEGKYDFNFTILPMVSENTALDYTVTHTDRFCLVLPKGHPLTRRALDFELLKNEPFVSISVSSAPLLNMQISSICMRRGYTPRVISRYNRMEATLLSVCAGAGITIMPMEIAHYFLDSQVVCLPIPGDDCVLTSVAAWRRDNVNLSAMKFKQVLLSLYPKGSVSIPDLHDHASCDSESGH